MKITAVRTGILRTPLKTPFKTAQRTAGEMVDIVVLLEASDGTVGWGSAPPTAKVTGDTEGGVECAVREYLGPLLEGRDPEDLEACLDILESGMVRNTSAKAALDIALHDLWARIIGQPAWRLFGGAGGPIRTDVTVSVNPPEEMARDALRAVDDGFDTIKIKVGVGAEIDFERIKAIRDAVGRAPKLRIDANQGWKPGEAVRTLNRMADAGFGIELAEQPVKSGNIDGLAFVTAHSPIPVAADESCWSPLDAMELIRRKAADMINIKLMKCGGVRGARQIISVAQASGIEVMMGSMLECKISAAAAAHLSSSFGCVTRIDLDGPALCSADLVEGGPEFKGPDIILGSGPGFGVTGVPGLKLS
ncbi:MAG: dipeptide epimerase [Synergistaceae bacterium]|jgi:L-alanine-DL-glutamate epimerase-like enolase superfamily enzyme|nr:dipeptide epimerase [Synergistaceae bacterium]